MIRCPRCNCPHTPVQKTYPKNVFKLRGKLIESIKRMRRCRHCGHIFYTTERREEDIIKDEDSRPKPSGSQSPPSDNPFLK